MAECPILCRGSKGQKPISCRNNSVGARDNAREAVSLLEDGRNGTRFFATFFLASESLATALEKQNDSARALRVLEETSSLKQRVYSRFGAPRYGALWVRIHWRLAQLYRKVGPDEDARKIEEELRRLLAYADRDHPILMTLNGDPQPTVIAQAH